MTSQCFVEKIDFKVKSMCLLYFGRMTFFLTKKYRKVMFLIV